MADTTCSRCSRPLARLAADGLCETCRRGETGAHNPRPPGDTQFLMTPAADPDPFAPTLKLDWAETPPPLLPGYDIRDTLGGGGMGVVYLARDEDADRLVALKVVRAATDRAARERFRVEVRAMARLSHPNVVRVYAVELDRPDPFFTMEYVDGPGLDRRLVADGPLPVAEAARVMEQVARAVQHAHDEGVIHRDLKPGNVIVGSDGVPKVTDFGLAKRLDTADGLTVWDAVLGTPGFMAPEQAGGHNDEVGPPADVYGLGSTLYALLTGQAPFRGTDTVEVAVRVRTQPPPPPSGLRRDVPADLEAVVLKCLEKYPASRYASAGDVADELARWLRGERTRVRPPTRLARAARAVRRRGLAITAGTAALGMAGMAAAIPISVGVARDRPPVLVRGEPPAPRLVAIPPLPLVPGIVVEFNREQAVRDLQAGKRVTLVGPDGPHVPLTCGFGEHQVTECGNGDTPLGVQARWITVLELLSDPGIDRYRVRAELRQATKVSDEIDPKLPSTFPTVGLVVGYFRLPIDDGKFVHALVSSQYYESDPVGQPLLPPQADVVTQLVLDERFRSGTFTHGGRFIPLNPAEPGERPWRTLEVDVTPDGVIARHDGGSVTLTADEIRWDQAFLEHRVRTSRPGGVDVTLPEWQPRLPLGLWVRNSHVCVRSVTVEPLP